MNSKILTTGLTRRDFMKKSTMAAGGGLLLGSLELLATLPLLQAVIPSGWLL